MAAKFQDKVLFGIATLVLLATAGWVALEQPKLLALSKSHSAGKPSDQYVPAGIDAPEVKTMTWESPGPQTRGPLWIYDVFTPPEIYYNATTREFVVTPPVPPKKEPDLPPPPFGVELVQIKPDVFRLQLVGYVGDEGDYRGTFENALTGDTLLARAGKKLPDLGLTVRSFEVKRNRIESKTSMPIYDTVATAVVVDDKTGEAVTLTNKVRCIKGPPFAVLKVAEGRQIFEQKAGTAFDIGPAHYSIQTITVEPASVQIIKTAPDLKVPETKTLLMGVPVAPSPAAEKAAVPAEANAAFPSPAFP